MSLTEQEWGRQTDAPGRDLQWRRITGISIAGSVIKVRNHTTKRQSGEKQRQEHHNFNQGTGAPTAALVATPTSRMRQAELIKTLN